MKKYLEILEYVRHNGEHKSSRTGVNTLVTPTQFIQHDLRDGFPLVTTKKLAKKTMMVELEGFIGGITDKRWYQERGCKIWNEWSSSVNRPSEVSAEDWHDLGPIYGYQWRNFNDPYEIQSSPFEPKNVLNDQLYNIVQKLKTDPNCRRMVCSAWNPNQNNDMALMPCHIGFVVQHINGVLHLSWTQRSCDMFLGVPFNLASYSLLLSLLATDVGMEAGMVSGTLIDCHIYENHLDQVDEQLSRTPYELPTVSHSHEGDIFKWTHKDTKFNNYKSHGAIKAPVAV